MQNADILAFAIIGIVIWLLGVLVIKWLIYAFLGKEVRYFTCWWMSLVIGSVLSLVWHLVFRIPL